MTEKISRRTCTELLKLKKIAPNIKTQPVAEADTIFFIKLLKTYLLMEQDHLIPFYMKIRFNMKIVYKIR